MKITYINEMADLCETVGADVQQVARGIGLDGRIGGKFLNAGPGYGGSCFPKDTSPWCAPRRRTAPPVRAGRDHDRGQRRAQARPWPQGHRPLRRRVKGKTVGVLGLTFKPNTDDMRDAPSLAIVPALQAQGAVIQAFDPEGHEARKLLPDVDFKDDPYACAEGADVLVIITEWDQFRALDLDRIKLRMNKPGAGRPAQHLQARRHARARLRLCAAFGLGTVNAPLIYRHWSVRDSTAPVHVVEANDIVLTEIAADLNFDQLERDLSGIAKPVNVSHRNVDRFILVNDPDFGVDW